MRTALEDVQREIAIMKKMNHKNVANLYEVIENPEKEKIYLIMEFFEGGQIIDWDEQSKKFKILHQEFRVDGFLSEDYLRKIFRDLIKGMFYLHSHNIIHRDIKPQNILLDKDGNAKIVDFGISRFIYQEKEVQQLNFAGTQHFMSPELFQLDTQKPQINGELSDIWSLGVTFYAFIFLELPFLANKSEELAKKILKSRPTKFALIDDRKRYEQKSDSRLNFIVQMDKLGLIKLI